RKRDNTWILFPIRAIREIRGGFRFSAKHVLHPVSSHSPAPASGAGKYFSRMSPPVDNCFDASNFANLPGLLARAAMSKAVYVALVFGLLLVQLGLAVYVPPVPDELSYWCWAK